MSKPASSKPAEDNVHMLEPTEFLAKFKTDAAAGLSDDEAKARLERDGPNRLTPPASTPEWIKFVKELTGFFSLLLWAGCVARRAHRRCGTTPNPTRPASPHPTPARFSASSATPCKESPTTCTWASCSRW